MDDESGESMEPMEKVPLVGLRGDMVTVSGRTMLTILPKVDVPRTSSVILFITVSVHRDREGTCAESYIIF